jgi:hypothetical protein
MRYALKKRLSLSYALETLCMEIYEYLSRRFPEANELWSTLKSDEEKHAEMLMDSYTLELIGELPVIHVYPFLDDLKRAVSNVKAMRDKVAKGEVSSLDEALKIAQTLEQLNIQIYQADELSEEMSSRGMVNFVDIVNDETAHIRQIEHLVARAT